MTHGALLQTATWYVTCHPPQLLQIGDSSTPPRPITVASQGGAVLCLQRRHSSQGMNVTPALPELGIAARCPSDKHPWPQEEVQAHRTLAVTLVPGHCGGGRHYGLPAG